MLLLFRYVSFITSCGGLVGSVLYGVFNAAPSTARLLVTLAIATAVASAAEMLNLPVVSHAAGFAPTSAGACSIFVSLYFLFLSY